MGCDGEKLRELAPLARVPSRVLAGPRQLRPFPWTPKPKPSTSAQESAQPPIGPQTKAGDGAGSPPHTQLASFQLIKLAAQAPEGKPIDATRDHIQPRANAYALRDAARGGSAGPCEIPAVTEASSVKAAASVDRVEAFFAAVEGADALRSNQRRVGPPVLMTEELPRPEELARLIAAAEPRVAIARAPVAAAASDGPARPPSRDVEAGPAICETEELERAPAAGTEPSELRTISSGIAASRRARRGGLETLRRRVPRGEGCLAVRICQTVPDRRCSPIGVRRSRRQVRRSFGEGEIAGVPPAGAATTPGCAALGRPLVILWA